MVPSFLRNILLPDASGSRGRKMFKAQEDMFDPLDTIQGNSLNDLHEKLK